MFNLVKKMKKKKSISDGLPKPLQADIIQSEEFRTLRTNIEFAQINHKIKNLLVTSSIHSEGKTTVATNLAHVMGQTKNKSVLIVDGDLRRPSVHRAFDLKNTVGLTSLLMDESLRLDDVIQQSEDLFLSVLTCGPIPPNPSELLSSNQMIRLMEELSDRFDFVIYDTPPVNLVTDAKILAMKADGVLMVVRENYTEKKQLVSAQSELQTVEANILGYVFNDTMNSKDKYYRYKEKN